MLKIRIAGVTISIDLPEKLLEPAYDAFSVSDDEKTDIAVEFGTEETLCLPEDDQVEEYDTEYSLTRMAPSGIVTLFHGSCPLKGLSVRGSRVVCVKSEKYGETADSFGLFDLMKGGIFLALRKYGVFLLHSASIVYDGKVYAFSALSGTGKTTHVNFWQEAFGVPVFNGDMIALRPGDVGPVTAYGVPWSGDTGIFTVEPRQLGGIFFLERGSRNEVSDTNPFERRLLLTQRLLAVNYNHREFIKNAAAIDAIADRFLCARLFCRPEAEAAYTAKAFIDARKV